MPCQYMIKSNSRYCASISGLRNRLVVVGSNGFHYLLHAVNELVYTLFVTWFHQVINVPHG
jgi:hypothetical protein